MFLGQPVCVNQLTVRALDTDVILGLCTLPMTQREAAEQTVTYEHRLGHEQLYYPVAEQVHERTQSRRPGPCVRRMKERLNGIEKSRKVVLGIELGFTITQAQVARETHLCCTARVYHRDDHRCHTRYLVISL